MKASKRIGRFRNAGMKWKIFSYFILFAVILLVILWLVQTVFLDFFYRLIKTNDLKSAANEAARCLDDENAVSLLETLSEQYDVSLRVTDYNFNNLYLAVSYNNSVAYRLRASEMYVLYSKAADNGGETFQAYQYNSPDFKLQIQTSDYNTSGEDFIRGEPPAFSFRGNTEQALLYARIVQRSNSSPVLILADTRVTPVDSVVKTLRFQLIQVSWIMLLLALVLAFAVAKFLSSPIAKITHSAEQLAAGNYNIQFDGKGYREITRLNDTLNEMTVELGKAAALQRELIANVSHDLRTPLTMIIGYSEVMRDLPGENTPENVQIIIDEAKRLTTLVNDMLDLSKLQSGVSELTLERYNFTDSVAEIIERFQKYTESNGYTFQFIQTASVMIRADKSKINRVVYNLLINAVNYSGEDKTVTVRQTILDGKKVRLEVCDTGEGIPKQELPYIWDRYYKTSKAHKRAFVGTGIGLSIVKTILELHRADFGVNSVQGKGSTFWFEFPLAPDEGQGLAKA